MAYDWSSPYDSVIAYNVGNVINVNVPGFFSSSFGSVGMSSPANVSVSGILSAQALFSVQMLANFAFNVSSVPTSQAFPVPTIVKSAGIPVLIQSNKNNSIVGNAGQIAFTSNLSIGSVIVVAAGISSPTTVTGVNDTAGNVYVRAISNINAGLNTVTIWYAPVTAGSGTTPTISVHTTGTNLVFAFIWEYRGLNSTSLFDVSGVSSGSGSVGINPTSGSLTTNYVNDLLVGICMCGSNITGTEGGWTPYPGSGNPHLEAELFVATNPGTYAATFTQTTSSNYNAALATLRSSLLLPVNMSRVL